MGRWRGIVRSVRRGVGILWVLAVVTAGWGYSTYGKLPRAQEILPELAEDPLQVEFHPEEFEFPYRGNSYLVQPVAKYSIAGLLVTHNNIAAFDDIYHTSSSVDIRDLCLIWGENVEDDTFHTLEFWSEPFSCWVRPKSREAARKFRGDKLSNTHILAADEQVRSQVLGLEIGDQVRLSGVLVNYHLKGHPEWGRRSSTVRTDEGNGACETMLIQEVEILKRGDPTPHRLYRLGVRWGVMLAVLLALLWGVQAHVDYRRL